MLRRRAKGSTLASPAITHQHVARTRFLLAVALIIGYVALSTSGCTPVPEGGSGGAGVPPQSLPTEFAVPEGRAVTIEDYYQIKSLRNPQISPDGRRVAYSVSTPIEEDNSDRVEAWVVTTDGSGEPRHIVHNGEEVSSVGWTNEGLLRYRRDGTWAIDLDDPQARPVRIAPPDSEEGEEGAGGGPGGQSSPGPTSPDGQLIVTLQEDPYPEGAPAFASDFVRRHQERFEGVQFDWMYFQRDGRPIPVPDPRTLPAEEIALAPADKSSEPRTITELGLRPGGLAWHPEGSMLVFTADSRFRDEMTYGRPDLWTVTVDGEVTRLTDDGYTYGSTAFSPDGRFISYIRGFGTDMIIEQGLDHGGPRDLYLRPVEGGEPVNLTADWDLDPRAPLWHPSGDYVYFMAGIGGATHLFRVPVDRSGGEGGEGEGGEGEGGGEEDSGGEGSAVGVSAVEQITQGQRRIGSLTIDDDFETIAYTVGHIEAPSELFAANIDGSEERQLAHIHDDLLEEITFSRAERLLFTSDDGTPLEGWLLYPYDYNPDRGPYPLIVNSHGGPHSASGYSFSFKQQYFAANGYFVLQTNFRSSTGYGDEFKWATWGAWGDKDGQDVMAGVDYVLEHFAIDPDRVGVTGHSYGGFMRNWLITQYPDRIAAAVVGAGISNWISDYGTADIARTKETEFFGTPWEEEGRSRLIRQSPLTYAGRVTAPTLFIHGEVDQRVPYGEAEQMYFAIKKQGVPAKMIRYAGMSHGIRGHWNVVHRVINELAWWERWLKNAADENVTAAES